MITSTAKFCFGHFAINGFKMESGIECSTGLEQNIFSRFDMVLSGHFHHKMKRKNIDYVGAMYENNWSDWDDPRGVSIFDTDTEKLTFFRNPYRMFHKIFYNDGKNDPDTIDVSDCTDKYVKIVIEEKSNVYKFDTFLDRLNNSKPNQVTIEDIQPEFDEEESKAILDQAQDTPTILASYIDDLKLEIDSNKMKILISDLYQEAISLESVE